MPKSRTIVGTSTARAASSRPSTRSARNAAAPTSAIPARSIRSRGTLPIARNRYVRPKMIEVIRAAGSDEDMNANVFQSF